MKHSTPDPARDCSWNGQPRRAGLALRCRSGDYTVPAARDTEPVILTGQDFARWGTPLERDGQGAAHRPAAVARACDDADCDRTTTTRSPSSTRRSQASSSGTPTDRLLGYRWDGDRRFEQIPFQVDEVFTRYLDNSASGFAVYSGEDQHTTYAYDREGFRLTDERPGRTRASPSPACGPATTPDPVTGLDNNDELAFMASDAGAAGARRRAAAGGRRGAPRGPARRPDEPGRRAGVRLRDEGRRRTGPSPRSTRPTATSATSATPTPTRFEFSESCYEDYGNAARGHRTATPTGNVVRPRTQRRRRPRDNATITTDRYRFRYDGRWLMTEIHDLARRRRRPTAPTSSTAGRRARSQQDPGSETPCCGYEEEDTNWGGSSTLLGERVGPVRAIRETWGADSGTNVIRRETFYRDEMRQKTWLRVHVIPPLDGIYAQWDFNAGRMTTLLQLARNPDGVAIDGRNDEVVRQPRRPLQRPTTTSNDTGDVDQSYRDAYGQIPGLCEPSPGRQLELPYHQSIDLADPTFSEPNAALELERHGRPDGTIVDRYHSTRSTDLTAGGARAVARRRPLLPRRLLLRRRHGHRPGPEAAPALGERAAHVHGADGRRSRASAGRRQDGARRRRDALLPGLDRHPRRALCCIADSDNARQTVPLTEIVAEQRMVMLPGRARRRRRRALRPRLREAAGRDGAAEPASGRPAATGVVRRTRPRRRRPAGR